MLVCPKEIVAKSASFIDSALFIIPFASPGKSIPETCPKPNFFIYSVNFSLPIFSPNFINPTLHEFWSISGNVCSPCPPCFQHFIVWGPTCKLPPHVNLSVSLTRPSSNAVTIVTTLNIEPGSNVSFTKLFLHIFCSFSASVFPVKSEYPSNGLLGSKSGLFTIAKTSPLFGSITNIETLAALLSTKAFSAAFSAKAWIFLSIVRVTSLPVIGAVNLDIVYETFALFLSNSDILIPGTPDKYSLYCNSTPVNPCPSTLVLPRTCAKNSPFG